MDIENVLIPGGGGPAGIGAIKSLRHSCHRGYLVSTDMDPLSAGLYLADRGYTVPASNDPRFFEEAEKIIDSEDISLILPTSGFDIVPYSRNKSSLERKGVTAFMSDHDVMETCMDKLRFYERLRAHFEMPLTTNVPDKVEFPCIIKPRAGKGGRGVHICRNPDELLYHLKGNGNVVIQQYLPGKEYTIDVLSDLDGNALVAVPRERICVKAGISFKGRVLIDEAMQSQCIEIAEELGLKGPSCMQMKCDEQGRPLLLEVNPRMGGGTIMATYAGVNIPQLVIDIHRGDTLPCLDFKEIVMLRHYEELILDCAGRVLRT